MSINLANIYAELLRKYGDNYTITYNSPPSYLGRFVGAREASKKIVFFYREDRKGATTPTKLLLKTDRITPSDMVLDLTGSPLKDDCVVDTIGDLSALDLQIVDRNPWKQDEIYHRGEPVEKARAIICSEKFQQGDGIGSVWFLCDGSDFGHTLLLQYEFSKTHFARGIVSYEGVMPSYMVTSQSLVRQHGMAAGGQLETYIENCYQLNPQMVLRCSWSTPATLPLLVDLSRCHVLLNQKFRVGDCAALTEDFMNQLRILVYIREDIVSHRRDEKLGIARDPIYRCGTGVDMDELRESINKTMTEVSGFTDVFADGHSEYDIEEVVQRAKQRKLTDLTDKLWELLKCCSSYKDLKIAFNMLFQCAVRCNIVNTPTNKNRLAEIISNLANSRLAMPCLSGAEPLELLLEIGLEKAYKDYEFIFTESKVCSTSLLKSSAESTCADANDAVSSNDLSKLRKSLHNAVRGDAAPIGIRKTLLHHAAGSNKQTGQEYQNGAESGFKNSNFDEQESVHRVSKLFQIHCTLEHLLMIHINLNLPNVYADVCTQLLNKQPTLVESIDDALSDVVDIQLSAHYVSENLDGKDPHSRQITMKSQNTFREHTTTFYFNLENICPPELAQCFQCDDKELVKERTYHSWIYRKIRTLK
ncbi:protein zwilch [Drosophila grimshawi]|uniref:Protein zwilch n=1 Tax=Drosophila grimshawi TaxID=7222 RepID=B4JYP4_DROGR|nr:protein zwilch [Drosophila grimshawi]EDV90806.1 GH14338 [Drosophila grimshawi]